jgi:hypothetical protein
VYNTFTGLRAAGLPPNKSPVDLSVVKNHLHNLCGRNEEVYNYFVKWLAHRVQRFGELVRTAPVLRSKQGVGKNLFVDFFGEKVLGDKYYVSTEETGNLLGKFNGLVCSKLLINLDEASGRDTFEVNAKIKAFITNKNVTVQKKGVDQFKISNYASWVFTTNKGVALKVEDSDRRIFAVSCDNTHRNDPNYLAPLLEALADDRVARGFYDFLMEQDITGFDYVNERPVTELLYREMKEACTPTTAKFLIHLIGLMHESGQEKLSVPGSALFKQFREWCAEANFKTDLNESDVVWASNEGDAGPCEKGLRLQPSLGRQTTRARLSQGRRVC